MQKEAFVPHSEAFVLFVLSFFFVVLFLIFRVLWEVKDWVCHCLLLPYQKVRGGGGGGLSSKVII